MKMITAVLENVKIAGVATSVPPVSSRTSFENVSAINVRRSSVEQTASDLAFDAATRVLAAKNIDVSEIGFLLFISRTPDYRSPITAAVLQGRLGLSIDCICYDLNKGSNGFITGILTGASILSTINKSYGLVLVGDTPSKLVHEGTFFSPIESDAGSAILLEKEIGDAPSIVGNTLTLSSSFKDFSIPKGGFRYYGMGEEFDATVKENFQLIFQKEAIFDRISSEINEFIKGHEQKVSNNSSLFFHSMMDLLNLPSVPHEEEIAIQAVKDFGNTYGSNIPIQLALKAKTFDQDEQVEFFCISFGEGLELSSITFSLNSSNILPTTVCTDIFDDFRITHEM
ncbi:MAG: hypothetical protein ACXIUD_11020 [Mongoliitalea sp.]